MSFIFIATTMSKHFTFLRHSQSVYNRDGKSGRDPRLTKDGRDNASQLKGDYEYALVSCMRRTRETFSYASNLTAGDVEYNALCREKISGARHSGSNLMKGEENIDETEEDFQFRISLLKTFLRYKAKEYETILIVCHSGVIEAITGERMGNGESIGLNELL